MSRASNFLVGTVIAAGIGGIVWYHYGRQPEAPAAPVAAPAPPPEAMAPPPAAEPEVLVPDEAAATPAFVLPALPDSDAQVRGELETLAGREPVESFLIPNQIVRRWVGFIDSLDRDGVPLAQRPMKHVPGVPPVEQDGGRLLLGAANAQRYSAYMAVVQAVDAQKLVSFYFRYYPLFQRAYEELGYGKSYFNTRLLKVIDHLLATPVVEGPIELVRPKVLYQYADADLESRSFGQKLLIRIGPGNAAVLKAKLREIRAAIVARAKAPPATN